MTDPIRGFDAAVDCSKVAARAAAAGFSFIARYYSNNVHKNLLPLEAKAISAAGLDIVAIWEAAGNVYGTFTSFNGQKEAKSAVFQAQRIGQPKGSAIYFAADFDATSQQVENGITAYMGSVKPVMDAAGYKVGVYGSGLVCGSMKSASLAELAMLACAPGWRGTAGYKGADIQQGLPTTGLGIGLDPEHTVRPHEGFGDFGAWRLDASAAQPGQQEGAPTSTVVQLPTVQLWIESPTVAKLQQRLSALGFDPGSTDGRFGCQTQAAVIQFQQQQHIQADGQVGPETWAALDKAEANAMQGEE